MNSGTQTTSLLTFGMGADLFALALTDCREIVSCHTIARVPHSREAVRGLINLRGSVVPVIDLAKHFGIGETALSETTCAVLFDSPLDGENSTLAALVDEIQGVIEAGELAPAPQFGTPVSPEMLRGIAQKDDGFAYVVDVDAFLESLT